MIDFLGLVKQFRQTLNERTEAWKQGFRDYESNSGQRGNKYSDELSRMQYDEGYEYAQRLTAEEEAESEGVEFLDLKTDSVMERDSISERVCQASRFMQVPSKGRGDDHFSATVRALSEAMEEVEDGVSDDVVTELMNYIENNENMYTVLVEEFFANLMKRKVKGKYNSDEAVKFLGYYVKRLIADYAQYNVDFMGVVDEPTKLEIAKQLVAVFESQAIDVQGVSESVTKIKITQWVVSESRYKVVSDGSIGREIGVRGNKKYGRYITLAMPDGSERTYKESALEAVEGKLPDLGGTEQQIGDQLLEDVAEEDRYLKPRLFSDDDVVDVIRTIQMDVDGVKDVTYSYGVLEDGLQITVKYLDGKFIIVSDKGVVFGDGVGGAEVGSVEVSTIDEVYAVLRGEVVEGRLPDLGGTEQQIEDQLLERATLPKPYVEYEVDVLGSDVRKVIDVRKSEVENSEDEVTGEKEDVKEGKSASEEDKHDFRVGAIYGMQNPENLTDEEIHNQFPDVKSIPSFLAGVEHAREIKPKHVPVNVLIDGKVVNKQPFTSSINAVMWARFFHPDAEFDLEYVEGNSEGVKVTESLAREYLVAELKVSLQAMDRDDYEYATKRLRKLLYKAILEG